MKSISLFSHLLYLSIITAGVFIGYGDINTNVWIIYLVESISCILIPLIGKHIRAKALICFPYIFYFLFGILIICIVKHISIPNLNLFLSFINYLLLTKWCCLNIIIFCMSCITSNNYSDKLSNYVIDYGFSFDVFITFFELCKNRSSRANTIIENNRIENINITFLEESIQPFEECCICLFDDLTNKWIRLDCGHRVHHKCIQHWFIEHKTCPTCRTNLELI